MLSRYASDWKDRLRSRLSREPHSSREPRVAPSRSANGGPGWMHTPAVDRRQPQDGAFDPTGDDKRAPVLHFSKPASHLERGLQQEPEDAQITGSTRSLTRRLLGLNIARPTASPQPIKLAAKPVMRVRQRKSPIAPQTPVQAA